MLDRRALKDTLAVFFGFCQVSSIVILDMLDGTINNGIAEPCAGRFEGVPI